DIELHRADRSLDLLRSALDRESERICGIVHAKRHGIDGRPVRGTESCSLTARLHVQDEIDAALLETQHVLGAMARYGGKTHRLEQPPQCLRVRTRKL